MKINHTIHFTKTKMIKLNVGGRRFMTERETLLRNGPNYFTALLNNPSLAETIYIDRSAELFEWVLQFQRVGKLYMDENQWRNLAIEAEYYLIEPLIEECKLHSPEHQLEQRNIEQLELLTQLMAENQEKLSKDESETGKEVLAFSLESMTNRTNIKEAIHQIQAWKRIRHVARLIFNIFTFLQTLITPGRTLHRYSTDSIISHFSRLIFQFSLAEEYDHMVAYRVVLCHISRRGEI